MKEEEEEGKKIFFRPSLSRRHWRRRRRRRRRRRQQKSWHSTDGLKLISPNGLKEKFRHLFPSYSQMDSFGIEWGPIQLTSNL